VRCANAELLAGLRRDMFSAIKDRLARGIADGALSDRACWVLHWRPRS
jgi:hypothetical protein